MINRDDLKPKGKGIKALKSPWDITREIVLKKIVSHKRKRLELIKSLPKDD